MSPLGLKARVGAANVLWWRHPEPGGAPTLTVRHPTLGDISPDMTAIRPAATTAAADAIEADRRTLTMSEELVLPDRGVGHHGAAYLVTAGDGWFPVSVVRISGSTVILAEPLPRGIVAESASLVWADYYWTAPAGTIAAGAVRNIPCTVRYTAAGGANMPGEAQQSDEFLLHVVRQPFSTGLTHGALVREFPILGTGVARGAQDYSGAIDATEADVVVRLRQDLAELARWEDDVLDAGILRPVHGRLAVARLVEPASPEYAEALRVQADDLYARALRRILVDIDQDGEVDNVDEPDLGPGLDVRGKFTSLSRRDFPVFRRRTSDDETPAVQVTASTTTTQWERQALTIDSDGQTDFTLTRSPTTDSSGDLLVKLFLNGEQQTINVDYQVVARTLTWLDPGGETLDTDDTLEAWFVP